MLEVYIQMSASPSFYFFMAINESHEVIFYHCDYMQEWRNYYYEIVYCGISGGEAGFY